VEGLFGRVAAGYGVAVTLENSAPKSHPMLRVLTTDCEPLELCAVWHRKEESPLLRGFLDIVRHQIANTAVPEAEPVLPKSLRGARATSVGPKRTKKPRANVGRGAGA
jgi:hypothetical protein